MPSFTPRLGILQPALSDLMPGTTPLPTVPPIMNDWSAIDTAMGCTICTSTTRPSTPYDLQTCFETDTRLFILWDASISQWVRFNPDNPGRLLKNLATGLSAVTVPKVTQTLLFSLQWSPSGWTGNGTFRYKFGWQMAPLAADSGNINVAYLLKTDSVPVTLASSPVAGAYATVNGNQSGWGHSMAFIDYTFTQTGPATPNPTFYVGVSATVTGGNGGVSWQSPATPFPNGINNYFNVYGA